MKKSTVRSKCTVSRQYSRD